MISFQLRAVGELARNPELCARGQDTYARFCLIGQDEVAEGVEGDTAQGAVTHLWFSAFGDLGASIAQHARKGDRLFIEARVVADVYIEGGERQCAHRFIVTGVHFGTRAVMARKQDDMRKTPAQRRSQLVCVPTQDATPKSIQILRPPHSFP